MPIIYDLDSYNGAATCRNVAKHFIKGWVAYLSNYPAQLAGVYGSACSSCLSDFASLAQPPQFIFAGNWGTSPSTSSISCISSSLWANSQRHKQYDPSGGPQVETYGGVQILVDEDCSNGPVYATQSRYGSYCL